MFPYQKYKAPPGVTPSKPAPAQVQLTPAAQAKPKKARHTVSESVDESIVQDGRSDNTLSD